MTEQEFFEKIGIKPYVKAKEHQKCPCLKCGNETYEIYLEISAQHILDLEGILHYSKLKHFQSLEIRLLGDYFIYSAFLSGHNPNRQRCKRDILKKISTTGYTRKEALLSLISSLIDNNILTAEEVREMFECLD